jgi:hypothetical protein
LVELCAALKYIHEEGIIHRDLKSANIYLKDYATINICNFDWAYDLKTEKADHVTCSVQVGTPFVLFFFFEFFFFLKGTIMHLRYSPTLDIRIRVICGL